MVMEKFENRNQGDFSYFTDDKRDVLPERLKKASSAIVRLAPRLDESRFTYVLINIGLETYADYDEDGNLVLADLSDLQVVALAAAMTAFSERLSELGVL